MVEPVGGRDILPSNDQARQPSPRTTEGRRELILTSEKARPPSLFLSRYRVQLIQELYLPDRGARRVTGTVRARSQWLFATTVPAVLKETKAVRGDQMEVLEILGKSDQRGH